MSWDWLLGRSGAPRAPVLVAFLVLVAALFVRAADPGELERLRDQSFDGYQRLKPRIFNPEIPVRIIDIDEAALAEYGQWPWPRTIIARLVDKLAEQGVAAIAFDAIFAEPDRSSISRMVRDLVAYTDPETVQRLAAAIQDNDQVFADAIAQSRVVMGFGFDLKGGQRPPRRHHGVAFAGDDPVQFLPIQAGTVKSIDILEAAAKGGGSVNTDVHSVVIRRVPMLFRVKDQQGLYPALSIEALRVAQGAGTYLVKSSGASGEISFGASTGIVAIRTGDIEVRTDALGRVSIHDTGHVPERFVSAYSVLKGELPPGKLEGHVVFVGTSAIGLKDLRNTPVNDAVPGVEVHAQLAEQILAQSFLARPDFADGAELIFLAALGLVLVVLLPWLSAARMVVVASVMIGTALLVPWIAFSEYQLLFDPVYPPATLAAIYISGTALTFMRTERERAQIRGAFGLYLSPDLVEQLARNPKLLQLGGEQREITTMFTDVRGFTTISEQCDPQGLTRFMNRFLTPMTDLIMARGGTIDKYMGDAIMAFWNAPLPVEGHAVRACETVLAMQADLERLNELWRAEAEAAGKPHLPVNIGVGLNTGLASVGNFGSTQRFTYSALGDSVNLASRVEGQCKTYGVGIIIGDRTRTQAPDFAAIELDLITVKGKTEPERIHCLLGDAARAAESSVVALLERQATFLAAYRAGRFADARTALTACEAVAAEAGWRQGYYAMMGERLDELMADPPADWNGVYVAKEK